MSIKQFKLTNNDEIICEVVEWNTGDEVSDIIVKKALRVIAVEDYQKGWRFFAFRPWMSFQDDVSVLQALNASHIIVTTNPSPTILKHYKACIRGIAYDLKHQKKNKRRSYANLDEIQEAIREMTDDEMDEFLERKYGSMAEENISPDSDNSNIIQFKPKDKTVH